MKEARHRKNTLYNFIIKFLENASILCTKADQWLPNWGGGRGHMELLGGDGNVLYRGGEAQCIISFKWTQFNVHELCLKKVDILKRTFRYCFRDEHR